MAIMKSNFSGTKCATCGELIKKGEDIDYRGKTGGTHHLRCIQPVIDWEKTDAESLADKLKFNPRDPHKSK